MSGGDSDIAKGAAPVQRAWRTWRGPSLDRPHLPVWYDGVVRTLAYPPDTALWYLSGPALHGPAPNWVQVLSKLEIAAHTAWPPSTVRGGTKEVWVPLAPNYRPTILQVQASPVAHAHTMYRAGIAGRRSCAWRKVWLSMVTSSTPPRQARTAFRRMVPLRRAAEAGPQIA